MTIHTPSRRTRHLHLTPPDRAGDELETDTDDVERLMALTSTVEAALATDDHHRPTLVAAVDGGEDIEVLLRPLDHHPAVELEGLVAPPSWWCLGVVAGATATALDPWPGPPDPHRPDRYRVHLAHVVSRSGAVARVLRDRRRDALTSSATIGATDDDGDRGQLDDYLRRALGVATPAPRRDTLELHAALWIHHVMNEAAPHRLLRADWPTVANLHPAVDHARSIADPDVSDWALDHLVRAGELLAEANPWERVRAACQLGIGPVTGRPAELAGWLDVGAFARLVMSAFGPLEDLLVDLHELLAPAVYARMVDTVGAWGLLDGT